MSKIKEPSEEVKKYIKENYTYSVGEIDGIYKENVGFIEKTHNIFYHKIQIGKRKYRRSHIVWFLCKGWWPILEIDHKDKNSLNDEIKNLREVTIHEQQENKSNSKMYKGFSISFCKGKVRQKPWRVRNQRFGINLGYFESEENGKVAVDSYLEKYGKWWI